MNSFRFVVQKKILLTHIFENFKQLPCRGYGLVSAPRDPRTAILMVYTGGPKCRDEIECFVKRVLLDPMLSYGAKKKVKGWVDANSVIPRMQKKYERIDYQTPQFAWIDAQTKLVEERLDVTCVSTSPHKTFLGCQYVKPSIYDALRKIISIDSIENILVLPMYSQYSCGLTGGAFNTIYQFFKRNPLPDGIRWGVVDNWATTYALIKNTAYLIKKTLRTYDYIRKPYHLVFAARPMPPVVFGIGDFYPYNVGATMMHIMRHVGIESPYTLAWHYGSSMDKWLEPTVGDTIRELVCKGEELILLAPISTVVENLVTYYDYDIYLKKRLIPELGDHIRFVRVPAPNTASLFITSVAEVCKEYLIEDKHIPYYLRHKCPFCENSMCNKYKPWFERLLTHRKIIACARRPKERVY